MVGEAVIGHTNAEAALNAKVRLGSEAESLKLRKSSLLHPQEQT
jgi:hypothetical protein